MFCAFSEYPDIKLNKPVVSTDLQETEDTNEFGKLMVNSRVIFNCKTDGLVENYTYDITWFINDNRIGDAKAKSLRVDDLNDGKGFLLEEHWKSKYHPNMLVKCGIQARTQGFQAPTPILMSDNFFAGIKIDQHYSKNFVVKEKEKLEIPVVMTIPVSCQWRKEDPSNNVKRNCRINLLNGIPKYQTDSGTCKNGIKKDGVKFTSQLCGIHFNHLDWKRTKYITVWGESDGMINNGYRLSFIRLYNDDTVVKPTEYLEYWTKIHLPDIKVLVEDGDDSTRGTACYSQNDPHMRTFDGRLRKEKNGLIA
ncbi:unnamed protein product [Mytilus coruscus]|uniref:Ig-like domain-containing protein n=1 Tax=Mytilus coruscus TaxID=42192 RepID=A0A6J8CB15_MYTCO|nr:unnamed protein product [Mytilus coruscus]